MGIMIEAFPCSEHLEPYLRNFLQEHSFNRGDLSRVSVYGAYCLRRYNSKWKKDSVVKIPTEEQIRFIRDDPFAGAIFGGSLVEIMSQQKEIYPNVHIPRVIAIICDSILECGGAKAEGIFRISARSEHVFQYKVKLEKGLSNTLDTVRDPHISACLLKTWFSELKNSIIPSELYDSLIENDGNLQKISEIIYSIPDVNRFILFYLVRFLRILAEPDNQIHTKMGLSNLARIFSPNLFRCPHENPMVRLHNTTIETSIMEIILKDLSIPDKIPGVYGERGSHIGN